MKKLSALFVPLALFWLALSGHYTTLLISFGVVSCGFVAYIAWRMDIADHQGHPIPLVSWKVLPYLAWLVKEIVVSSITLARMAFAPRIALKPAVTSLDASEMNEMERVVYANSITLTPGTLTLDVSDSELLVHTVRSDLLDSLKRGDMSGKILDATVHPKGD